MTTAFPATPDFSGHNAPSRIECDIFDLVVEGTLPAEFEGSWYRSVPDPQYPPLMGDDTYLSGDGLPGEGPIARIKLPMRLRSGVHGSWVPSV